MSNLPLWGQAKQRLNTLTWCASSISCSPSVINLHLPLFIPFFWDIFRPTSFLPMMSLAVHNSSCPFAFQNWFLCSCSLYLLADSVTVNWLVDFHFLKENLLQTYYAVFLLFFLPIEKICFLGFNVFAFSYSQLSSFLRDILKRHYLLVHWPFKSLLYSLFQVFCAFLL